jgi:predicted dehydrogenase
MNRRAFLRTGAATGMLLASAPAIIGQSEGKKYKTALIGCGWWGKNILREAIASKNCKVVGLCDVDANDLEITAEQVNDLNGDKPKSYRNHLELLEKEKPEIVIIATPDHWHALQAIDSLKAGAHVFVEKPTGHTVNESRAILHTAHATGQVVQCGLHRRVGPHHVSAMKFLKSGAVGTIGMVRLFADSGGGRERATPNSTPPDSMDWNQWCGPAPLRPFSTRLHPGGWRGFLDYANGTIGDWGVHWMDQVLWWTEEKYPKRIFCSGGRPISGEPVLTEKEQTSDAPDHLVAVYEFENFTCTWEHRHFAGNNTEKHSIGAYFYGTNGILHIGWRDGWTFYPTRDRDKTIHEPSQLQEPDGHNLALLWTNFIGAIEKKNAPAAGIESAHRASVMPLLGIISWRLGRSIAWDREKETITNDPEGLALLSRPYRSPWVYPTV